MEIIANVFNSGVIVFAAIIILVPIAVMLATPAPGERIKKMGFAETTKHHGELISN